MWSQRWWEKETISEKLQNQEVSLRLTQSHQGPQQKPSSLRALQGQTAVLSSCSQKVLSYTHHQLQEQRG